MAPSARHSGKCNSKHILIVGHLLKLCNSFLRFLLKYKGLRPTTRALSRPWQWLDSRPWQCQALLLGFLRASLIWRAGQRAISRYFENGRIWGETQPVSSPITPEAIYQISIMNLRTKYCRVNVKFSCKKSYLVQIWGLRFSSIVGFRSVNFAQSYTLVYWNRINRHFGFWEKKYREQEFWPLENESSPFCRTKWLHIHVKIAFLHLSVWLKVAESSAVGAGSIPGGSQLRQKSVVGLKFANSAVFYFLKTWNLNPSFNRTYLTASFHRFRVLAKAM